MNKKIYVKTAKGDDFIKKFLPEVFITKLYNKSSDKQYKNIFDYISDNYKLSKKDIFNSLKANLIFSKYGNDTIISSNDNVFVNADNKLSSILALIDYGNLEVKGTNLINTTIDWINSKISYLYIMYVSLEKKKRDRKERS